MKTPEEMFNALGNRGEYAALPSITLDEVKAIYREGQNTMRAVDQDLAQARIVIHKLRLAINEAIAISGTGFPQDWTAAQVELCNVMQEVKVMLGEKGESA